MPRSAAEMIAFLQSPEWLRFLSDLTGIDGLMPDPTLLGGGIHKTLRGGHLEVHADFNIQPQLQLHRRINVLLYLNPTWEKDWGGQLELWDREMTACVKSIEPISNRMVIFNITDEAFHGHPRPLKTSQRLSLALYYYTKDRPEKEKGAFHWADWKQRPDLVTT